MTDSGNLDHWEQLASFHGTGDDTYYDIPALVSGDMALRALEQSAIDRVTWPAWARRSPRSTSRRQP